MDFSSDAQESDPQKLFVTTEASYTGYAAFTSAVGTYLIKRFGMDKQEAKPKKGSAVPLETICTRMPRMDGLKIMTLLCSGIRIQKRRST